jgi:hypothetical protein
MLEVEKSMGTHLRETLIAMLYIVLCVPVLAQTNDTSAVMDQRMRTIAGDSALNCGRVRIDGAIGPALVCARKAIARKQSFLVRFDHPGMDSDLSDGLAGDASGNAFLIRFDSLGWGGEGTVDNRHNFIEKCPSPVRVRVLPWVNNRFAGVTCKRKKKHSDDRYEQ